MSDEIKFKCEECGKEFEPDPAAMVEIEMGPELLPEADAERMEESGQCLTAGDLREADAEQLQEWGLTEKERDLMLSGESVATGGICICVECQDRMAEEQA